MSKKEIIIPLEGGTFEGKPFVFVESYLKILRRQLIMFKGNHCQYVIQDMINAFEDYKLQSQDDEPTLPI